MNSIFEISLFCVFLLCQCVFSYHDQYIVPAKSSHDTESYILGDKEFILQNLPVTWDNAKTLCNGYHNGTLAVLETKEKAEFIAEALSESQFSVESVWLGARRDGPEDPEGYRWGHEMVLRRTAADVLSDDEQEMAKHFPLWINRTRVPVPEGGADCVALERVFHDRPVFADLPCGLERPFLCERDARRETTISELQTVRCRTGIYRVFDGRLNWDEAAAYCVMRKMALADISTMRCLKKLGLAMLKSRPSIENAWVGAKGVNGKWWWTDTGVNLFSAAPYSDVSDGEWPPMRDRSALKPSGCLSLDRHSAHPPRFLEARCQRKMQFICYQSAASLRTSPAVPSDDSYYYVLVRELYDWQQAYNNCLKMNGTLASVDTNDILIQLLLIMGENKDEPISHIWLAGKLNITRDPATDITSVEWINPANRKRIPDPNNPMDVNSGFLPPWLDEDVSKESGCLNLDRQQHLRGLLYGLPCDNTQPSICMIEKEPSKQLAPLPTAAEAGNITVTGVIGEEDNINGVLEHTEKTLATENTEKVIGLLEVEEKNKEDHQNKLDQVREVKIDDSENKEETPVNFEQIKEHNKRSVEEFDERNIQDQEKNVDSTKSNIQAEETTADLVKNE